MDISSTVSRKQNMKLAGTEAKCTIDQYSINAELQSMQLRGRFQVILPPSTIYSCYRPCHEVPSASEDSKRPVRSAHVGSHRGTYTAKTRCPFISQRPGALERERQQQTRIPNREFRRTHVLKQAGRDNAFGWSIVLCGASCFLEISSRYHSRIVFSQG